MIWPLSKFQGRICQIFSLVFWSKGWHQKDILKLTDLYNVLYGKLHKSVENTAEN